MSEFETFYIKEENSNSQECVSVTQYEINTKPESPKVDNQNQDLNLISSQNLSFGITVWNSDQQALEEQALEEFKIFAEETKSKECLSNLLETSDVNSTSIKPNEIEILENYIKQQETFKTRQLYHKSVRTYDLEIQNNLNKRKKTVNSQKSKPKKLKINNILSKISDDESNHDSVEENDSDSEYIPSDEDNDECNSIKIAKVKNVASKKRSESINLKKVIDDGDVQIYQERLNQYYENQDRNDSSLAEEIISVTKHFKMPSSYWNKLYKYQHKAVKWLWSLHRNDTGGLLGDEMGLGKTVQIIAFLYGLEYSKIRCNYANFVGVGPTIIVCPATVIHQWVRHFHEWAPEFRVAVLHQTSSFTGCKSKLIKEIHKSNGILITTYTSSLKYSEELLNYQWYYVILDEGHKIRNPNAKVTITLKKLRTPHRIILTGSPMQNNLQELWSLFNFTNPEMLGTLNTFMEHFANPIIQGGFANATSLQEATALSVATALKSIISPFMLRRTKKEVQEHIELPNKNEQVLFCSLTEEQTQLYKDYLQSDQVGRILVSGNKKWNSSNHFRANMLIAITNLRKICNHPDLFSFTEDHVSPQDIEDAKLATHDYKKSGKMIVVAALLKIWRKQKHRVLIFSQVRAMITLFEEFLIQENFKYLKMDGGTSINSRQNLIDKYNQDDSYEVFLLTTRVGGLGVNLTGANRVIIYDPDWNPATDKQATERAWRIGQNKDVTVYRLLSAGTIEEKMYQRQIWKQLLSEKILTDPKTHKAFKSSDLYDLFSLQEPAQNSNPETTNIFRDSRVKIQEHLLEKEKLKKEKKLAKLKSKEIFSDEKVEQMKLLAKKLAQDLEKEKKSKMTSYQKELEKQRLEKKMIRDELIKLPPQDLMNLNREKVEIIENPSINKIDDSKASCSFTDALEVADKNAKLYHKLVDGKLKMEIELKEKKVEEKVKKKKNKHREKIDNSGIIDGEKVEGLVKTSTNKKKEETTNDDFILSKLFSNKGVSGALEHESIIGGKVRENNLRISAEANERANKAVVALKKSRLAKWRW